MTINVTKYRLNPDRIFAGTRGSYGMEKLSFDFGDGWDFETISVTFHPQRGKPIRVPLLPGVEIDIPAEVMAHSGESRFVVSGIVPGDGDEIERKAVSLEGYVDVAYTSDDRGGNARKVTPDTYDLFLAQAKEYMEAVLLAAKESGAFDGADGISIVDVKQTLLSEEDGGINEVTVTLSNGKTFSFRVRNGSKGADGRGILRIVRTSGDGSPGTTDVYTIMYTDGIRTEYTVYNGKDGSGGIVDETDPTVPEWAKQPSPPVYTAAQVGADPAGTAAQAVAEHNVSPDAHTDIRTSLGELAARLNAFFDSDDQTLDELSEIVEYIKSNKTLIDAITTSKVSVTDIVDNLVTNLADRPLSAARGVELRQMIEAIAVPDVTDVTVGLTGSSGKMKYFVDVKRTDGTNEIISFYGGHNPVNSTDEMTQPVGADSEGKLWTQPAPVDSVNGKTGTVKLGAADVGARPSTWVPTASEVGALPASTEIPSRTSDLTNDSGFITKAAADLVNYYTKSQTYTQAEVNALVSAIPKFAISVVTSLPTTGISATTVYLVKSGSGGDLYTEYIHVNGAWEILGSQRVDLTGYATESWVSGKLADYLPAAQLQTAIDDALAQAKASGEFDGADGITPHIGANGNWYIGDTDTGVKAQGESGRDYVLTEADKTEIAAAAADLVGVPEVVQETGESETAVMSQAAVTQEIDELSAKIDTETTARENAIADLNARLGQQTLLIAEGETVEEALAWLETNGDKTKAYLMPDDFFYMWRETTEVGGAAYTNRLPLATDTDRTTVLNGVGYKTGYRLSSSGSESAKAGASVSGFIPVNVGDVLRIKGIAPLSGVVSYIISYDSTNTKIAALTYSFGLASPSGFYYENGDDDSTYTDDTIIVPITTETFGSGFDAVRFNTGTIDENTIVTINEEIVEGTGTVIVEKWASTGHGLVATDYDETIAELRNITDAHTIEINELKEAVEGMSPLTEDEKLERIKTWDAPIYDANIPIFELSAEKAAITEAEKTVDAVYAKYDALMAKHPNYITKTNLGMCSDGVTPVYRYDFREPEPHRGVTGAKEWSETKTKAIIVSGIHWEWGGIFALYNALEEIAENPNLYSLRRNTHLIVLPVCNPYAVANMSVRNANLIEIHRNFEVDFIYPGEPGYIELGERSHGGTEPLSEVETQYIDNIFRDNTDAALFLTCHSNQQDSVYGTGFTWASPATYYMCNMHYRLVDKLSEVWMGKYGDELAPGIADYRTENTPEWDTRLGSAYLSTTNGTETKQATKYGIQATNIEVCDTFLVHGTKANPEPALSSFTMSRGAEVYINFLLTAFGIYDYKDKEQYYK